MKLRKVSNMEKIENGKKCEWCGKELVGRQTRFCSNKCNHKYYNSKEKKIRRLKTYGNCEVCGTKLKGQQTKFCSDICDNRYRRNKNKKPIKNKKCKWCGEEFTPITEKYKYCSKECSNKYWNNGDNNKKKKPRKNINCLQCSTELTGNQKRFCSRLCSGRYNFNKNKKPKIYKKCEICKTELIGNQKKYCSKKCKTKRDYEEYKDKNKIYRENNKDKINKRNKEYTENNKDKINKRNKEYRKNNKDKINKRNKEYRKNNKDKTNKYFRKRYKEDLMFKLNNNISTMVRHSVKHRNLSKNGRHWEDLIINTIQEIIEHLEKNFLPGMSWKNHGRGGWHIDHIIPITFFKFSSTDDPEFKYCWSINNLQPLWAKDNLEKSDKMMLWGKEIDAKNIDKYTNAI